MSRTTYFRATAAAAAALFTIGGLAGCAASEQSAGSPEGDFEIIYTAGAKLVTDWDVYVAEDQGFFEDHGVHVENVSTDTAEGATQLLVTGEAHIGRGLPPMIQATVKSNGGVKLLDVADTLIHPPFFMSVREGISSLDDLVGKNIGTSSHTDSTTVVTHGLLDRAGIDAADVEIVTAGGTASRFAGLESGALDASALLPPINYTAEENGFASLGYLPDLAEDGFPFAFAGVIVNPDWAEANREALVAYLKARGDALEFLADPANRDEAIRILAEATDTEVEIAERTYDDLHIGTDKSAFNSQIGVHPEASEGVLIGLQKAGLAPEDLTIDGLVDDSYAAEARG
ncbi:ABC transporter substrate-binding protein [Microbacterium sp. NPDC096154]|uniref:ABC transporter substrate-binding protein n=1 Tax=Microbacterium sp. NPDC096154 TaxID=3155549 RepID=UPI00333124D6